MSDNLIASDLKVKGRASYLILLQTVNDLTSRQTDAPPSFNAVKEDIIRFVKNFPPDAEGILTAHRQTLTGALREVFTLNLYADIARDWLAHGSCLYAAAAARDSVPDGGKDLFFMHLQAMIDLSEQDDGIAGAVLQKSVSQIPLRMAALKYKSYITDSLKKSLLSFNAGSAESFKRFFNPMGFIENIGWMDELRKPLDEIWAKDCAVMNPEEIVNDIKTADGARAQIARLVDYLCVLFDGVNAAYISALHCPADFDKEEAGRLIEAQLDKAIEAELRNITYSLDSETGADANDPLYGESKRITEIFYETGLDYFDVFEGVNTGPGSGVDGFLADFLPCLDAPGLAANRKRFLRQHLMAYLPYPYGIEEYQKYFLDTYEALDDANRRYLCVCVANQVKESQEKSGK